MKKASSKKDSNGNRFTRIERDKKFNGYELLVNLKAVLFGGSSTEAVQHAPGRHTYRFQFKLPSRLPSSFEAHSGQIRYYIEARVDRPWKFDYKIRKPFTVNEIIDINLPRYSTVPFGAKEEQIECFCFVAGNVSVQASLDRSGYCPGERIFLSALCVNVSNLKMRSMRATLVQKILYRLDDGRTVDVLHEITSFEGKKIPKRSQDLWNNQPFLIPSVPPTIQTNPVRVSYQIIFEVRVPRPWGPNPKIALDITMGTVSSQRSYGQQCSHQLAENQVMEAGFPNQIQPSASPLPPPSTSLGYPDMPPPSYAVAVGGLPVNVGDTEAASNFGDQSYVPRYTYAQPFQGGLPTNAPSAQFAPNPPPYSVASCSGISHHGAPSGN